MNQLTTLSFGKSTFVNSALVLSSQYGLVKSRIGMPSLRSVVLGEGAFENCNLLRFEGMHSGGASLNRVGRIEFRCIRAELPHVRVFI